MKIVLLANRDLHANRVADALLRAHPEHHFVCVLSSSVGRPGPRAPDLTELARFEQNIPYDILDPLLPSHAPDPEDRMRTWREIGAVSDVHMLDRPRSEAGRTRLAALAPDLFVSVRYGGILDADVVALARHGVLNLHSGHLPAYRGVLATFRALAAGDRNLGCTLHRIVDTGIDTGPVVARAQIAVRPGHSVFAHLMRLYDPGIALLVDAIGRIAAGEELPGEPQDPGAGAYFSVPTPDDIGDARARGVRLVDPDTDVLLLADAFGLDVSAVEKSVRS